MPRKKPEPPPKKTRARRDPYRRALEVAQKRIVRAQIELERHLLKAEGLNLEIPRLEQIIATLSPDQGFTEVQPVVHAPVTPPLGVSKATLDKVPAHLRKFMMPDLRGVGSIPAPKILVSEDDALLPDTPGEELLP